MSEKIIAKKAAIVDEVAEKFQSAVSVVVVDYRGLTVEQVTNLRKDLREAGVEMRVIKNTYLKRAADKVGYEGLDETFTGPTAVAFSSEDVVAPARIMAKYAEDIEALEIKGGMIEGIDVPEVSLVAILDADKEGFLRAYRPLVQTMGRAARNANGEVIMYADTITDSMRAAINATKRRRKIQEEFNKEHGITPKTIIKPVQDVISITKPSSDDKDKKSDSFADLNFDELTASQKKTMIKNLQEQMKEAAKKLDFEEAANLRDAIIDLQKSSRKPKTKKGKAFNGK